jgi:hypothetical protein
VKVVAARNWTTTHDNGDYRGKAEGADLKLKVAARGRQLRDFDTEVTMFCVGPTIPDNHLMIGIAPVKRAKIAPDGRFYARDKHASSTVIELSGRVHNGRVNGQVELTVWHLRRHRRLQRQAQALSVSLRGPARKPSPSSFSS